jgi:hypothetical protein
MRVLTSCGPPALASRALTAVPTFRLIDLSRVRAAMHWSIRECTLASGREIEIVNVPGHCDYINNTYVVCIPRLWASCVCINVCARECVRARARVRKHH